MSKSARLVATVACPVLLALSAAACAPADDNAEAVGTAEAPLASIGDSEVFARIPASPGFPEGIALSNGRAYVSVAATFGTAGTPPSQVHVFKRNGTADGSITTQGEYLPAEHFQGCVAADGLGRIYVLNGQLGVIRHVPNGSGGYTQEAYATLPHLPLCIANGFQPPCSPDVFDEGFALGNDLAFDDAGNLYVTDSLQAVIWKIAPGGGVAQVWAASPRFAGTPFAVGLNGLRLDPAHKNVYVGVTKELATGGQTGTIFRLPLVAQPAESDITAYHTYAAGESPDGFAFAKSGNLYVTLVETNQISILAPDGSEASRLSGPPGSDIPYDAPANIAFDGSTILIVNHAAVSRNPDHFAVIRTKVGDTGAKLAYPFGTTGE